MKQARIATYIEFYKPESTNEIEAKVHKAFPGNIKHLLVGVDHKNFGYGHGNGEQFTVGEILIGGGQSIIRLMKCSDCNRTWSANGYRNDKGVFLLEGSEICEVCKNEGVQVE